MLVALKADLVLYDIVHSLTYLLAVESMIHLCSSGSEVSGLDNVFLAASYHSVNSAWGSTDRSLGTSRSAIREKSLPGQEKLFFYCKIIENSCTQVKDFIQAFCRGPMIVLQNYLQKPLDYRQRQISWTAIKASANKIKILVFLI